MKLVKDIPACNGIMLFSALFSVLSCSVKSQIPKLPNII